MEGRLKFNDYEDEASESAFLLYSNRSIMEWNGLNRLEGTG